jgi:hypothetical protein
VEKPGPSSNPQGNRLRKDNTHLMAHKNTKPKAKVDFAKPEPAVETETLQLVQHPSKLLAHTDQDKGKSV